MKTEEIIEVLEDLGSGEAYDKWLKRLTEAVYLEISASLRFYTKGSLEEFRKSITSYVMTCYDTRAVSLVLKLVNTDYEYLILEAIERFKEDKERL